MEETVITTKDWGYAVFCAMGDKPTVKGTEKRASSSQGPEAGQSQASVFYNSLMCR
jgi:hypothetical protein